MSNALKRKRRWALWMLCLGMAAAASAETIDVMIVFDTTGKTYANAHGGVSVMAAGAVAKLNQAAANSGLNSLNFRLVYAPEAPYTYADFDSALSALQAGSGGLSAVPGWRNSYAADLVAMLVDTGSAYGVVGLGYLLTSAGGNANAAFTVNAIRSVEISHTMSHEVGHNFGCGHSKNQATQPGPGVYPYAAGWYFTGNNSVKYHTIMAYNSDGYGNTYSPCNMFSTPLLTYQGVAAGNATDGDNARTISQTMSVVAAYRGSGGTIDWGSRWHYAGRGRKLVVRGRKIPTDLSTYFGSGCGVGLVDGATAAIIDGPHALALSRNGKSYGYKARGDCAIKYSTRSHSLNYIAWVASPADIPNSIGIGLWNPAKAAARSASAPVFRVEQPQ